MSEFENYMKLNIEENAGLSVDDMVKLLNAEGNKKAVEAVEESNTKEDLKSEKPIPFWYGAKALKVLSNFAQIATKTIEEGHESEADNGLLKDYVDFIEEALIDAMELPNVYLRDDDSLELTEKGLELLERGKTNEQS